VIIRLYFDEDSINHPLTRALRARKIDVVTALEAGTLGLDDPAQLDYAAREGRVFFSYNIGDFSQLHTIYLTEGKNHAGIIVAPQQRYGIGGELRRLLTLIAALSAEDMRNRFEFLSQWR
jgi:hypothetical protein